ESKFSNATECRDGLPCSMANCCIPLRHHHRNGRSTPMNAYRVLRHLWILLMVAPIPAWAGMARVYVTNSAGDSIHVIDPATNKVVQQIKGIEGAHGIAFSPDGSKVYVSDEVDSTL